MPPTSSLCHFSATWAIHVVPHPPVLIICLKGGPPKPKGMSCHLVIECWVYLSWILLGMDWWGDLAERVGLVCATIPLISFGCYTWILSPCNLLYWPFGSRVVLFGKPQLWVCGPLLPFIFSPTRVHIPILGSHRASLPIPLPPPRVKLEWCPKDWRD